MEAITLSSGVAMRAYLPEDAFALLEVVDRDRERLQQWMPWVPFSTTVESFAEFISEARRLGGEGRAAHRALVDDGAIVGAVGASIGVMNGDEAEVGYWLAASHEGLGIVTEATGALIDWLFTTADMHRVSLRAAAGNTRSRAVAERLGFRSEGVLRGSLLLEGRHHDAIVYGLLEDEWAGADQ